MRPFHFAGLSRFTFLIALTAATLGAVSMAGCSADRPQAASASAISTAAASEHDATIDAGSGTGYRFSIKYPQLPARMATLTAALHAFAAKARNEIVEAGTHRRSADEPVYTLDLEFDVARNTSDFVSVLGTGSEFTGGAHGLPIQASFNWHRSDATMVSLRSCSSTRLSLARIERGMPTPAGRPIYDRACATKRHDVGRTGFDIANMKSWIQKGTEPKAENFEVFLVDGLDSQAIGLTLDLPTVSSRVLRRWHATGGGSSQSFLRAAEAGISRAFAIDTEADKLGPSTH